MSTIKNRKDKTTMKLKLPSEAEIKELELWLQDKNNGVPEQIQSYLFRIISLYNSFISLSETNRSLADRLKEFMGIKPKSERGNQLNQQRGIRR